MRTRSVRHRGGTGTRVRSAAGSLSLLCALLCSVLLAQHAAGAKVWVLEIDGAIRAGVRRLLHPFPGRRRGCRRGPGGPAARHAGRPRQVHARHDQGAARLARTRRDLRLAERRPRGQRGDVHHVRESRRRHGPGDQHRFVDPRQHRGRRQSPALPAVAAATGPTGRRDRRRRGGNRRGKRRGARRAARHADGAQGRQRRGGVHPRHRGAAGPERGVGGTDGARGLQPAGAGRPGPERHRPGGRGPRRTVRGARRRDHRRGGRRGDPRHVRQPESSASSRTGGTSCSASSPIRTSRTCC